MSSTREPGAPGAIGQIPLSVPYIGGREWEYIKECLDTNFVSSVGPFVDRFERELAAAVRTKYAVAVVNGTSALHIALVVAGVEPDDEVLMPCLTFVAPANAVRYVGAWPVFFDVDPDYFQMDVARVAEFLEKECAIENGEVRNRRSARRVSAILPVSVLGHPCDMDALLALADRYKLTIIEDATESLGAFDAHGPAGSRAPIACLSFNGNKIITSGGGGAIVTNSEAWAKRAKYLTTQAKDDPLEFVHNAIGYNYRLTNVLAALGCAQLEQLPDFVAHKHKLKAIYEQVLGRVPGIRLMRARPDVRATFWMYTVLVDADAFGKDSRTLLRELDKSGIQARPLWCPLHKLPPYKDSQAWNISVAERVYRDALSLPCSVGLTFDECRLVAETVREIQARS